MKQSKVSARYYLFEDLLWETAGFAHLKRPFAIALLQSYADFVWTAEGGSGECPTLRRRQKNDASYYLHGPRTIHLARKHQCLGGLLHELAHALGPHDKLTHGPAFRDRCIRLYREYGGWDGQIHWKGRHSG